VAVYYVFILHRGVVWHPGPYVLYARGHVVFFAGVLGYMVLLLGGKQSDSVSLQWFPASKVLGVRRLA
jgi:hypothetical protein